MVKSKKLGKVRPYACLCQNSYDLGHSTVNMQLVGQMAYCATIGCCRKWIWCTAREEWVDFYCSETIILVEEFGYERFKEEVGNYLFDTFQMELNDVLNWRPDYSLRGIRGMV